MNKLKESKGVTLVALIITVVIMLIIAAVSVSTGTDALDETRLSGFYTQLEIVQKRVDDIATTNESYIDSSGNTIYLKEQGTAYASLNSTQQATLTNIIQNEGVGLGLDASNFRYFTISELESILDLSEIEYNLFIDFNTRTIIAEEGITIGEESYHILKSAIYFAEQDTNKNVGEINSLSYTVTKYGSNSYKIIVTPSNTIGDLKGGTLKYKKTTTKYWETATDLEMIISELTNYNIVYEDNNKNSLSKTIQLALDADGNPTVTEI